MSAVTWWSTCRETLRGLAAQSHLSLFPLRASLRRYDRASFAADLRGAVNVSLVDFPQSMAYALIAGLPVQYGIYCVAVVSIIGSFLSSSRHTSFGPTNTTAMLILSVLMVLPPEVDRLRAASLLGCLVGIFLVAGSFVRLADLTQFVSYSVMLGYVTGAACLIIANQTPSLLGIHPPPTTAFFEQCARIIRFLTLAHWGSLLVALLALAVWGLCRLRFPKLPAVAVTLAVSTLVAVGMCACGIEVETLKALPIGFWPVTVPPADLELFNRLVSGAAAIAFLALLENSSMGKLLAHRSGDEVNSNQDMLSLGVSNIGAAILSGMPASTSLTRSMLKWNSGIATHLSGAYSGLMCGAGVLLAGPLIGRVPVAALAMMVVCIGASLINARQIRMVLRTTKSDAAVFLTTFTATLLAPLDFAIFLGVGTSIVLFLRKARTPSLVEYTFNTGGELHEIKNGTSRADPEISIIHVEGELFFGASELFLSQIRQVSRDSRIRVVILRLKNARHLDATSIMAMEDFIRYLRENGRDLLISGVMRDALRVLRNSGLADVLGRQNLFVGSAVNPNVSTRNALRRAQQIIGTEKASVRVFYDPNATSSSTTPPVPTSA